MEDSITVGCNIQKDIKPISRLLAMKKRLHQQRNGQPKVSVETDSKLTGGKVIGKESESKTAKVKHSESESKVKAMSKCKSNGSLPQNGSVNPLSKIPKSHTYESDLDAGTAPRKSKKISRIFKSRSVEMKLGTENKVGIGKTIPRSKTTEVRIEDIAACEASPGGATVPKLNGYGAFSKLVNTKGRTQTSGGKYQNGIVQAQKNVPNTRSGDPIECSKLPGKHLLKPAYHQGFRRHDNNSQTMPKMAVKTDSRSCGELKQQMRTYTRVLITEGATVPEEQFRMRTSSDGYTVNYIKREISANAVSTIARNATCGTNVNQAQKCSEDLLQDSGVSDEGGFRPRPLKKIGSKDVDTAENEKRPQNTMHQREPLKLTQAPEGRDRQSEGSKSNDGESNLYSCIIHQSLFDHR